jgi:UDP-N-acetylmuramate dehydrogenase
MEIRTNVSLKEYTTFRIGGLAKFFTEVTSKPDLHAAVEFAKGKALPIFVLGGGSNVLVSDSGFGGLVIYNKVRGVRIEDETIQAFSGEQWDNVVATAVKNDLAGIECLSGIPGSAGGALVQNIGAYGQTIADVVLSAKVFNFATGQAEDWTKEQLELEYRNSKLKREPGRYFLVSFVLKLVKGGQPTTHYPDVKKYLEKNNLTTLQSVRDAVIEIRAGKGYVIMPGRESFLSAGSFFKNPVVDNSIFERIKNEVGAQLSSWFWPDKPGQTKLAAAFLLSRTGFDKGYVRGRVGISPKHSLAIINRGTADSHEVWSFAAEIQAAVRDRFQVNLEPEVQLVGAMN